MPDVSLTNLLVICAVAVAPPLLVGFLPWLRVPAVVLEIVAGIVLGPSVPPPPRSAWNSAGSALPPVPLWSAPVCSPC